MKSKFIFTAIFAASVIVVGCSKSEKQPEVKPYRNEDAHQTIEVIKQLYSTFCNVGKNSANMDNCYDLSSSYKEYALCLQTNINEQKVLIANLHNKNYTATETCSKKLETILLKNINGRLQYSIRQLEWLESNKTKLVVHSSIKEAISDCVELHKCSSPYRDKSDFIGDNNPNAAECTIELFTCGHEHNQCYPSKIASYLGVGCSGLTVQKDLYYKYNNSHVF